MSGWETFWHEVARWIDRHLAHRHHHRHHHHHHRHLQRVTLRLRQKEALC